MERFDESAEYTPGYLEDCAQCGHEFDRSDLAWSAGNERLLCAGCDDTPDPFSGESC